MWTCSSSAFGKILIAGLAVTLLSLPLRAEVKIGVFGPMSGDAAAFGQSERQGVEFAVNKQNAAGGLLGQKVVAIFADDAGKPEQAGSISKRLISSDGIHILLGSISSPSSLAASQVAAEGQTPHIVVGATAQKITTQGNPWVFRAAVPDVKLAGDLADFIHERYPTNTKAAFIYVNDDFGKGGLDAFKARAQAVGIQIVAEEKYTRGDIDFTSQLSRIRASGANLLIDWSRYTKSALIQKQFKQMGLDMPRFGCDAQSLPKFRELGGEAVNGMYYATHFSVATTQNIPIAQAFIKEFQAAYGKDPDQIHAMSYDAAKAAMLAIEKAGKLDRTAIRDALRTVTFEGVRGHFAFDVKGDPTFPTHIVLIKNGEETDGRAK